MPKRGSPDRRKRDAIETRNMIREAAAGMAAAGMYDEARIPWEHVSRRRIYDGLPDRRSVTGRLMGDPIMERSALAGRMQA